MEPRDIKDEYRALKSKHETRRREDPPPRCSRCGRVGYIIGSYKEEYICRKCYHIIKEGR